MPLLIEKKPHQIKKSTKSKSLHKEGKQKIIKLGTANAADHFKITQEFTRQETKYQSVTQKYFSQWAG